MKVAIGHRIQAGPWGGGNRFVEALAKALRGAGHSVAFDLADGDLDVIVMIDPRPRNPAVSFTPGAILHYVGLRNPRALVVHRINECDERKNTRGMNARLRRANYCADRTVFVASWLRELPVWKAHPPRAASVILNGADAALFSAAGYRRWDGSEPLRLVTHHWGGNWMKGFDVYEKLDRMLAAPEWRGRIEFSYIGNLPPGFRFVHARHVEPLSGRELADALRGHHVYLTASINEPGGNHQNEGALCGLPIVYRNSGCLPEYCDGFGVMFDGDDVVPALERMMTAYPDYAGRMARYPRTAARTCAAWLDLLEELVGRREPIVAGRRPWRSPYLALVNQLPI